MPSLASIALRLLWILLSDSPVIFDIAIGDLYCSHNSKNSLSDNRGTGDIIHPFGTNPPDTTVVLLEDYSSV
jgi:hypothetical protein